MCTLGKAIELYFVDAAKRCEPSTMAHYRKRLRPFERRFGGRELSEIKGKHVIALIDELNHWPDGNPKAPDTIRSNVACWEQFQKWLKESKTHKKPITKEKIPKPGGAVARGSSYRGRD